MADDERIGIGKTTLRERDPGRAPVVGYRLLVIGDHEPTLHRLPRAGAVTLGRSESADIHVDDPLMSRAHARVSTQGGLTVTDLGSSNGTYLRGQRLVSDQATVLSPGDTIELGSTVIIVQPEHEAADADAEVDTQAAIDEPMRSVEKLAHRIAPSQINVLLLGETGVGKEVMARSIHQRSTRAASPFVGINCAALSEALLESELFGHEKGAFTGAAQAKPGLIETADGGTLFLDEVGEMPLAAQAKLLRVVEQREVMRVGGLKPRAVEVRFIAATHRNLRHDVGRGRFREDLYYRLNGISIVVPPLRARRTEIHGLARQFLAAASRDAGLARPPELTPAALAWMQRYDWPGNIRELRNAVHRAVLLAGDSGIEPEHLRTADYDPKAPLIEGSDPVEVDEDATPGDDDPERRRILDALAACGGNQTRAARMLGIARRTLTSRLERFAIPRPRKR